MKSILFFSLLLMIFNSSYSFANDTLKVKSEIRSVTIFLNGAEINRYTDVPLGQERRTLVFTDLSPKLDARNIRVSVPDEIKILSVYNRFGRKVSQKKEKDLLKLMNDSIKNFDDKKSLLRNEIEALETEMNLLKINNKLGTKEAGVTIEELSKAADFYRTKTKEIKDKIFHLEKKIGEINEELAKIKTRYLKKDLKVNKPSSEVIIDILCSKSGSYGFDLTYFVNNAAWKAVYDIKAVEIDQPIYFNYNAKVYNNTGVDWNNVKIKLSTADPTLSATKPQLTPWTLNYSSSISGEGYAQNIYVGKMDKKSRKISYGEELSGGISEMAEEITVSELNAEFEIKIPYTIPAIAKPYHIEVTQFELPAKYEHISIPKMDRDAFLLARIAGWEDLDIIDGTANIYFGNTFIGQSYINTRYVGDTLDLSLGRDKKILVTRTKKKDFSSKKIIGLNKKELYKYELIIKNNRKVPVKIEIQDQVPVSQEGDIDVKVIEISGALHDDLTGKLTWNIELEPGQSKKLEISFSIKYPKNRTVKTRKYRAASQMMF